MSFSQRRATQLCARHLRWQLQRSFTSSSSYMKNGPLATFPKTSNRELDDILNSFREKVFFPNHVSKSDREMIYRPSKQIYLTGEEPVRARVHVLPASTSKKARKPQRDESVKKDKSDVKKLSRATAPAIYPQKKALLPKETFVMNPVNILTDIPKLHSNYRRMMKLMSAPSDVAIIPGFLRELSLTRMKITPKMIAGTIRRAIELDRLDVIMQMFESSDHIGLHINHPEVATQLMRAIVRHVATGYWTQDRLDKSLNYSDSVLKMLQDPQHRGQDASRPTEYALTLPQVWGAAMALSAIRQLRYGPRDSSPHRFELSTLAQGFVERLDLGQVGDGSLPANKQNMWLADWAPAIHGVKYTIQALGGNDPSAMKLQLALPALSEAASQAAGKVAQAFPDTNRETLGPKMTHIMETALEVEVPLASSIDEASLDQSNVEVVSASEAEQGGRDSESIGVEGAASDALEANRERKDAV